ncbi:MAG: hypothetical protein Q8O55_01555 [Dehalococcoidales bacterium]|nr:hypothetical protein [Dehalococcoidales bacterium]
MNIIKYLVIDSQTGKCRLLERLQGGFSEYIVKLEIEIPKPVIPSLVIKIPLPETSVLRVGAQNKPYGIPWALAEGIMEIESISPEGHLQLDYTDEGIRRLAELVKPSDTEGAYALTEYARRNWGLPGNVYIGGARFDRIKAAAEEGRKNEATQ